MTPMRRSGSHTASLPLLPYRPYRLTEELVALHKVHGGLNSPTGAPSHAAGRAAVSNQQNSQLKSSLRFTSRGQTLLPEPWTLDPGPWTLDPASLRVGLTCVCIEKGKGQVILEAAGASSSKRALHAGEFGQLVPWLPFSHADTVPAIVSTQARLGRLGDRHAAANP